MNQKTKPASVLIFTLIILFIGVVSAIGIASTTLISRKMSTTSGKSVASFQIADSGAEIVLQKMKDTLDSDSNAKITDMGLSCSNGTVTGSISSGKEYEVTFLDENGNQLAAGCSAQISDVQKIRSIGTYAQISRAIEAAVAAESKNFFTIDDTSLTCDAACTAQGGKCVAGFLIDRAFGGNPSITVMRSVLGCSSLPGGSYTQQCICYK